MDALELLKKRIDIVKLMEHYNFGQINAEGSYVRSCCAIHGGNEPTAFVANMENGRWYCHTGGCGGGDAFTLVQLKEGIRYTDSVKWLANFFGVEVGDVSLLRRKSQEEAELKRWIQAIQKRRIIDMQEYVINSELKRVTKFRDFAPTTLEHFELSWAKEFEAEKKDGGTYTLQNRLLFPIMQDGTTIGASLRRIRSTDVPKWSHQPIRMKTGEILYNYDAITDDIESVVVVEGIPDVWAYHEINVVAVATFGAHLTEVQHKMLLRTGKDIVLSYDGDEAGRITTEKVYGMMRLTTNLTRIDFADGEDPASITREELRSYYDKRA